MSASRIGFVAIGRNEGARLDACLAALRRASAGAIVYVDSGSTDDSIAIAGKHGADIVRLDLSAPFTAARARNAGAERLLALGAPDYVQFVDGDCELAEGWVAAATEHLDANPQAAVVCGRRREKRPEASLYNRLCDLEWATPVGDAIACGGDAMMRFAAIADVGFYNDRLIAGEEPELCLRLRERDWKIRRLDAEMTRHDAAMTRFSQWWRRTRRAGHAFAEVSDLHRASPKRIWRRETRRALLWAAIAPAAIVLAIAASPWFALALIAYPAQALRLFLGARRRLGRDAAAWAILTVLGKFAEAAGAIEYHLRRRTGRNAALIEYK